MGHRKARILLATAILCGTALADQEIFRGNLHTSLGRATLSINPLDQLVVGNIGSSGLDGVSVALGQADAFDVFLVPPTASPPPGAYEQFVYAGTVAGVPGVEFARMAFVQHAADMGVEGDFPGLGSSIKLVEAYLGGALVGVATVPAPDPVASVPPNSWPSQVGVRRDLAPHARPALICRWPTAIPMVLFGGGTILADEIHVVALTPSNNLDLIAQTDGTGSDVPELFIADEETQPTCPGDLDGDGDVDLADLAILLGNYGAMANVTAADGDLDHDGDVDLADMAVLLSHFGETC